MSRAIEVEGLVRDFAGTRALDGVNLNVPAGQVLGLLGPNGAGKTTVVRTLATLLVPTTGQAWVGGFDVVREAARVREIIGLTGQYASVDEKLTGRENLILIGRLLGMKRAEAKARADALLADFALDAAGHRLAKTYSGGMRRRLDLAASLVGHPRILFLDEPSTGLDPRARRDLWHRIRQLQADGTTVLLTTQYLEEADALADSIVVLDQGRVIAEGTAAQLKARVGARTLYVTVSDTALAARAAEQITAVAGVRAQVDGEQISAPALDPGLLPAVLRALDEANIEVAELGLRGASLDDVFLALTGQSGHPRPGEAEDAA
ncbi:MAG TPA: ATP-binding cassette domain-containing protein [Thioalkalivibrio sp.]|nr:ATP-binding cassette domain-containing protein [Thioalkalivibrio sp.]